MTPVRPGQVIFEIAGVDYCSGFKALKRASCKLPFKTKIVKVFF